MPERFGIAVMALIPHLIFLEIAALLVLRVIWWLPDWCLKVVVLVSIARRLHRSAAIDATDD
jgi:biotin transporter BioY